MSGTLYVVATPIGNLDDLSRRAVDVLSSVDLIAAEDTRHTGRLLSHFGVRTPSFALHEHNEDAASATLVERLTAGASVALVSDAGTPLLSDPGYRLTALAHASGIPVVPVPGPSAVTAALSASGLPTDRFCFEGFLPSKAKARQDALRRLRSETRTLVFFESVHRIARSLADMQAAFGSDRPAFIGRELSKLHEQTLNATLGELRAAIDDGRVAAKGEFVVIVAGAARKDADAPDTDRLLLELSKVVSHREAAAIAARVTGGRKNALYKRLLELSSDEPPVEDAR